MGKTKIKMENHKPIVYRYYDLLEKYHLGKENSIKSKDLASIMGINVAQQKYILKEINESPDFHKLISTCGSIYMCKTKEEVSLSLKHTKTVAITMIKKYRAMEKKASRQNQYQIQTGDFYKEIITVFED
jgi:hypothetical protein